MYQIRIEDNFAAAHFLRDYHGKCERLHGHNYKVRVYAQAEELSPGGMVMDFGILKGYLKEVLKRYDHTLLNEQSPFDKIEPSAELIARTIYEELAKLIPGGGLSRVEVFETEKNRAAYIPS